MSAGDEPPPSREPEAFRADRGDHGERLDLVVLRHLAGKDWASRTRIQAWIKDGLVRVNGRPGRPSDKVQLDDRVSVDVAPPPEPNREIEPQDIPLTVLYEDDDLLAIDKPAGLVVHPAVGHRDGTLVNALLFRSQDWAGEADRPGLVHRLDKDTTGVLVVAKSEAAMAGLQKAMKDRILEKEYWAVVYGTPPVRKGRIDLKIHRDPRDRKRMATSRTEGRDSTTLYELLGEGKGEKKGVSLLKCLLVTGRTHQIRVHLKALHLPIVGDPTYGAARWKGIADEALAAACRDFPRQALHARRLVLEHPVGGQRLELIAPLPADMKSLLGSAGLLPAAE